MEAPKGWTITFGEQSWTDADAKVGHLTAMSALGFDGWEAASPWNSPIFLAGWLTVLLADATEHNLDECIIVVNRLLLADLLGCLAER